MNQIDFSKEVRAAIRSGDIDRLVELLGSDKGRINMITPFGTWLHVAARVGNLSITKQLIELGADVNKSGGTFETGPLKTATAYGHADIVRYLLSVGAAIDLSEPFRNPLFSAIYNGRLDIVELLVEHGIDLKVKYTGDRMKGTDATAYARELGQLEIARFLESKLVSMR